jgi:hypothetical protein
MFLHQIFNLMYYMGFTYTEAYNLPIWQRIWFIERTNKELKSASDQGVNANRAAHGNSSDQRSLMGRHRENVPAKLRRFT